MKENRQLKIIFPALKKIYFNKLQLRLQAQNLLFHTFYLTFQKSDFLFFLSRQIGFCYKQRIQPFRLLLYFLIQTLLFSFNRLDFCKQ